MSKRNKQIFIIAHYYIYKKLIVAQKKAETKNNKWRVIANY